MMSASSRHLMFTITIHGCPYMSVIVHDFQINGCRDVMTAYYNAMRFWKFGLLTGIFVRDRIFVIIIIQFGGNLFRYYLVFVRQIIIIFVIVIVN